MRKEQLLTSWPRKIARRYSRLDKAVDRLLECVDDSNHKFAIVEFVDERIKLAKRRKPESE